MTQTGSALLPLSALLMLSPFHVGFSQDVLREMPTLPTGFMEQSSAGPDLFGETDLSNLHGSVALNVLYNSNVNNGTDDGVGPRKKESDTLVSPGLNLSYVRENQEWRLGADASVTHQQFLSESQFNTTNYSLNAFGGYQSKILVATFNASYSSQGGVNRINGAFLEQNTFSTGLMARYQFSGLTSLLLSWNQSDTDSQTGGFNDMSSNTVNLSALWQATPLLSIGPGVRYGVRSGDQTGGDFTVVGPTIRFDYTLQETLKLRSSIGYDFTDSPSGDSTLMNWSASLDYTRGLWGLSLSAVRDTQATFVAGGGFDLSTAYQLAYSRQLGFGGVLGLNASYNVRDPESGGVAVGNARDSEFIRLGASLSFPVFADRANFNTNLSWNEQSAQDGNFTWDGFQAGAGLSWSF